MSYAHSATSSPRNFTDVVAMIDRVLAEKAGAFDGPTFRGAALALQAVTDHEFIISGPAETGKTFALLWRLDSLLRSTPGAKAVLLRSVRKDMDITTLNTWRRIIAIHGDVQDHGGSHPDRYTYPNGSEVYIVGLDTPGKVLSGEFDFIVVNQAEQLAEDDWQTLSMRCTGRGAVTKTPMLMGDCNPSHAKHWILSRAKSGAMTKLESRHQDNPTLVDDVGNLTPQGERTRALLSPPNLTGLRYDRYGWDRGLWVSAEGVVYEFRPEVHTIQPFEIPPEWRRFRSIDLGYENPFVCKWYAISPDNQLIRYREIYYSRRLIRTHAKQIRDLSAGERIEATVCDHDAQERAELNAEGISTVPAYKAVKHGIQAVEARLAVRGNGQPGLVSFRNCLVEVDPALVAAHKPTCTDDEWATYIWPPPKDGKAIAEEPVKVDDHGMDSERYAVAYADGLNGKTISEGWQRFAESMMGKAS